MPTGAPAPVPRYSLQNTATGTAVNWEAERMRMMQEALAGLHGVQGEADQYANNAQAQAQAAAQSYQQAIQGPMNLAPPGLAAIPYAASQFGAALSGRPEVGQAADRSLLANRAALLQRRTEVLESLHEQSLQAAKQYEGAQDVANSLKYNTKANLYLKQLEDAQATLREARGREEDRAAENERLAAELAFRSWQTGYVQREETARTQISSGVKDPATKARLDAIERIYITETKPIQEALTAAMMGQNKEKQAKLQEALTVKQDEFFQKIGQVVGDSTAVATPPAPQPSTPAPPDLPKMGALKTFMLGGKERRQLEEDFVSKAFPGLSRGEVLDALQKDINGEPAVKALAKKYGYDWRNLLKAARKIPIKAVAPSPVSSIPDSTRAALRGRLR